MTGTSILFPVGRMVQGSLYEAQTKDKAGGLRVVKSGPRAGQPNPSYFFAVAIPKTPADGGHWANTSWGKIIWALGHAAFPQVIAQHGGQLPKKFAWKITDGDSMEPNEEGRVPSKNEGFPGHWVVKFSSTFAPKIFQMANGAPVPLLDVGAIKRGYYVEVYGTVDGNNEPTKPGVYINHNMVCLSAYGPEITSGPDPTAVGFGKGQLPAGASSAPVSTLQPPPAPAAVATPPAPAVPAAVAAPPAPAAAPVAVQPHPGILTPPPPPAAVAAAPPPPAAGPTWKGPPGSSYAQYKTAGWSDDQMRANGLM